MLTNKSAYLRVELAVVVDAGERFVQATYNLKGDGPLARTALNKLKPLFT